MNFLLGAVNNLISFLAFSAVLPLLHYSYSREWTTVLLQPTHRLFGSIMLAVIVAGMLLLSIVALTFRFSGESVV